MSRKAVVHHHFASSRLVQYSHFYPITEFATTIHQNDVHILDESIVAYLIIGYVVLHILDAAVIPHRYIVQGGMIQTGMFLHSACQGKLVLEHAQLYLTRETGMEHIIRLKIWGDLDVRPIVRRTGMFLQKADFVFVQFPIVVHIILHKSGKGNHCTDTSAHAVPLPYYI